jgi:hypothetical protein
MLDFEKPTIYCVPSGDLAKTIQCHPPIIGAYQPDVGRKAYGVVCSFYGRIGEAAKILPIPPMFGLDRIKQKRTHKASLLALGGTR